jgi:hypothetical protein
VTLDGSGVSIEGGADATERAADQGLTQDVSGVIRQNRPPQFISSAYFLRFKFEEGKYALVGRETIDGRDVLRIEYYPERMFSGTDRRRTRKETTDTDRARDAEFQRLMNKVALVTLWVEPKAHQIVKYTFDNVGFDFLPAQWLVHVSDVKATMTVGQPFPDVWLPTSMEINLAMTLALGQIDVRYGLEYGQDPEASADVTYRVLRACTLPVIVKLTPNIGDPTAVARAVVAAGANALCVGNTLQATLDNCGTNKIGACADSAANEAEC